MMKTTIILMSMISAIILFALAQNVAHAVEGDQPIDYENAKKAIGKFGGKVLQYGNRRDDDNHKITVRVVSFANSNLTDDELLCLTEPLAIIYQSPLEKDEKKECLKNEEMEKNIKEQKKIRNRLDLSYTKVTARGFRKLREITNLTDIDLSSTLVYDKGLRELEHLESLEVIRLKYTYIPITALRHLVAHLSTREIVLYLSGATIVNDAVLSDANMAGCKLKKVSAGCLLNTLKNLTNVKGLDLTLLGIKDPELKELLTGKLQHTLKWIDLSNNDLSNECLESLAGVTQLWWLSLSGNSCLQDGVISGPPLKELNHLRHLKVLKLSSTGITNKGLQQLDLKKLIVLDISNTSTVLNKHILLTKLVPWSAFRKHLSQRTDGKNGLQGLVRGVNDYISSLVFYVNQYSMKTLKVNKTGISTDEVIAISSLLFGLTDLDLSDTSVTNEGLEKIVRKFPKLTSLNFSNPTAAIEKRLTGIRYNLPPPLPRMKFGPPPPIRPD